MSYESMPHPTQMRILRYLLLSPGATFASLQKDAGMQSDQFTFHIKKLIKAGYVSKDDATYRLTAAGKEYANRMDIDTYAIERQAKISVVVIVEDDQGNILHQQRRKHPYYGYWGHISGKVRWGETLLEAAARELAEETGLSADLRVVSLYHKLDYDDSTQALLEDKYLCIVHGTHSTGNLIKDAEGRHNEWLTMEEFAHKDKKFGEAEETLNLIHQPHQVILEKKYSYEGHDY
ncbi:MAG TPA: NUDIX domain-containing protein [Candidatus Saccharimonadales bacterium]|nr:NUDIX domain-containing protein [Candidatus Saccharimonadales bacterium]